MTNKLSVLTFALVLVLCSFVRAQQDQTHDTSNPEDIWPQNAEWVNGWSAGYWVTCTSGLTCALTKGTCFDATDTRHTYAGGTVSVTNATNYIDLKDSDCSIEISTSAYQSRKHLATVVAAAGTVSSVTNDRGWFVTPAPTYVVEINGTILTSGDTLNFNDSTPAAAANGVNVKWQKSTSAGVDSISAYLLGDGTATHFLNGTGVFSTPSVGSLSGSATCSQLPALTGDTTSSAGSCATSTIKVNGASLPTSASYVGTNSSGQIVSAATPSSGCSLSNGVNAQTSGYTLVSGDAGKLVTFNGTSLTATMPASPPSSTWCARIENLNATSLTVSRNGLTINGGTSNLTLAQYQTVTCVTDGSNYFCTRPIVAGTNVTITESSNQESIASSGGGGGGGLVLLEQHTANNTSAELDFTSCISATYDEYEIEILNLVPATNGTTLYMQFSANGGTSYDGGTDYWYAFVYEGLNASTSGTGQSQTSTGILLASSWGTSVNPTTVGTLKLYNPASTTNGKQVLFQDFITESSSCCTSYNLNGTGVWNSLSAANAFRFIVSSGNLSSGTIRVYGLTH
jgi:hypothetical protein